MNCLKNVLAKKEIVILGKDAFLQSTINAVGYFPV